MLGLGLAYTFDPFMISSSASTHRLEDDRAFCITTTRFKGERAMFANQLYELTGIDDSTLAEIKIMWGGGMLGFLTFR